MTTITRKSSFHISWFFLTLSGRGRGCQELKIWGRGRRRRRKRRRRTNSFVCFCDMTSTTSSSSSSTHQHQHINTSTSLPESDEWTQRKVKNGRQMNDTIITEIAIAWLEKVIERQWWNEPAEPLMKIYVGSHTLGKKTHLSNEIAKKKENFFVWIFVFLEN